MSLTKQFLLSLLLVVCFSAQASHEAKGGDPLKNRFRQIGKFLTYHLQHDQVRLGGRLKSLDTFQSTVPQVPIELVDEFPPDVTSKLKEPLTGMTVDDPQSPVGKKILLHRQRFEAALKRFDDGQEVTLLVLRDSRELQSVQNPQASLLIEGTFLGFCFHEFLLASHEEDTHYELSSLLSANKEALASWTQTHGWLKDQYIYVTLPRISGAAYPVTGDEQADKRQALSSYAAVYANGGRASEEAALQKVRDSVEKRVHVVKAQVPDVKSPTLARENCMNRDEVTCMYQYYTQKVATLYLDTDAKIDYLHADVIMGGDSAFSGGDISGALVTAYTSAYQLLLDAVSQRMPELEKTYRAVYGDDFLYLDFGPATFDHRAYSGYGYNHSWPNEPVFFWAEPTVYFLKHDQ